MTAGRLQLRRILRILQEKNALPAQPSPVARHQPVFFIWFSIWVKNLLKISKTALKVLFSESRTWNLTQKTYSTNQFGQTIVSNRKTLPDAET